MNTTPPENCPGVSSQQAGVASQCAGCPNQNICSSGDAKKAETEEMEAIMPLIRDRMIKIKHIILVISGKGGTGKSTISANLARAFAIDSSIQVGLLDLDICGPSAPRIFGLEGDQVHKTTTGWTPVYATDNLGVMSCGFLLDSLDDAVIWRGPKKNSIIKQLLMDVDWGKLDYLIVDTPPGTSDEHISVVNYLKQTNLGNLDGVVMVTTPQEISLMDVRKQIDFCTRTQLKILGIVENMSKFICPKCSKESTVFHPSSGGAHVMGLDHGLEVFCQLPLNPFIGHSCDLGQSIFDLGNHEGSGDENLEHQNLMNKSILDTFLSIRDKVIEKIKP